MKILSNGYYANFPKNKKSVLSGGTSNFDKIFSKEITDLNHEFVSVFQDDSITNKIKSKFEGSINNINWWSFSIPQEYFVSTLTKSRKKVDAEYVLKDVISLYENILKKEKPDIVLLNGFHSIVWCLFKAAKNLSIPVVMQHAGISKFEFDNYAKYYSKRGLEAMKEMEVDASLNSNVNIFLNETSKNIFLENVVKTPDESNVIISLPLIINIEKQKIKREIKKDDIVKIGLVARWDIIKNHNAYMLLAEKAAEYKLPWKFYAVTKIPQTKIKINFKKKYKKYIEIIPPMLKDELNDFYREMDIMILPSHFETASFVVIEASLVGTSTVISEGVGHSGIFKKFGADEFIVDFSNTEKALKEVQKLIKKSYPNKLMDEFKKIHNPKKVIQEYLEVFNKIIKNK